MKQVVIGVDVGTGSARAGVFDASGKMLGHATHAIQTWKDGADVVEQSSDDIWNAACRSVKKVVEDSGRQISVKGIGFTATCSLVVLDGDGSPLTVSNSGVNARNIIVWMDHRAVEQADFINQTDAEVLRYTGGKISVEMQIPKLLWLKQNLPSTWKRAAHFFDLPDFLTWRASGSLSRSMCSLVCKWTYDGLANRWDKKFLTEVGLEEFLTDDFVRIGGSVKPLGSIAGLLSKQAAQELGLPEGIPVGTSAIDAHAGGLGLLGIKIENQAIDLERRLALIGGTSSCHMAVSANPRFVPGVWGPYYSALIPEFWLNEGGQSATGSLIDHVIFSSCVGQTLKSEIDDKTVYEKLNGVLSALAKNNFIPASLTADLHVLPDFHGNRSPRADASLLGMISGIKLSDTTEDLARLYLATIQSIAYGTRHIVETLNEKGYAIDTIFACGGGTKNAVFLQEHADALGMKIILGAEEEAVLLGSAILAGVAAGIHTSVSDAMAKMSRPARVIEPALGDTKKYHDRKYQVFKQLHLDQMNYREMMSR